MPRDIDNQIGQALQGNHRIVVMVKIAFDSPLLAHSRFGELVYDGETYYGIGAFGNISTRTEDSEMNPQRLTLTLTGIPLRFIEEVTNNNYQNRAVYIYKGYLADDDSLIGGMAVKWFRGVTANAKVTESTDDTCSVELTVSNWLSKWRRSASLRYNNRTQKELFNSDTGLQYVVDAQEGKLWRPST
jgi:hypothetical protein